MGSKTDMPRSQRMGDEYHRAMVYSRVRACSTFVIDSLGCLDNMQEQRFKSCGKDGVAKFVTDCLGVYNSTDPEEVRHLISPKWLEEMSCFSFIFLSHC